MAYRSNNSPYPRDWSNRKLVQEIRSKANMVRMGVNFSPDQIDNIVASQKDATSYDMHSDMIREATRLYRDTWLNPLISELERRLKLD